jgi:hypothetical protein
MYNRRVQESRTAQPAGGVEVEWPQLNSPLQLIPALRHFFEILVISRNESGLHEGGVAVRTLLISAEGSARAESCSFIAVLLCLWRQCQELHGGSRGGLR